MRKTARIRLSLGAGSQLLEGLTFDWRAGPQLATGGDTGWRVPEQSRPSEIPDRPQDPAPATRHCGGVWHPPTLGVSSVTSTSRGGGGGGGGGGGTLLSPNHPCTETFDSIVRQWPYHSVCICYVGSQVKY